MNDPQQAVAPPQYSWPEPPYSATRSIEYGWNKFTKNWTTWVLASLISFALSLTIVGLLVVGPMLTRGALDELDGKKPRVRDFFKNVHWGPALIVDFLVAVLTYLPVFGSFALLVAAIVTQSGPGLVFGAFLVGGLAVVATMVISVLTYYAGVFPVERGDGPITSIKASYQLFRANIGQTLLLYLLVGLVISMGTWACYVGLLASLPVGVIAATHGYRVFTGGEISADKPPPPVRPQGYGFAPPGYGFPPQGYGYPSQGYGVPPHGYGFPPPGAVPPQVPPDPSNQT